MFFCDVAFFMRHFKAELVSGKVFLSSDKEGVAPLSSHSAIGYNFIVLGAQVGFRSDRIQCMNHAIAPRPLRH